MKTGGLQRVAAAAGVALLLSAGAAFAKAPPQKALSKKKPATESIQEREPPASSPKSHAYASYLDMMDANRQAPQEEIEQAKRFELIHLTPGQLDTLRNAFLDRIKFMRQLHGIKTMPIINLKLTERSQKFADTLVRAPTSLYGHFFAADVIPLSSRLAPFSTIGKRDTSRYPLGPAECLGMGDSLTTWSEKLPSIERLSYEFDQLAASMYSSHDHRLIIMSRDTVDRYCGVGVAVCWEHRRVPNEVGPSYYRVIVVYNPESTFDAETRAAEMDNKR